MRDITYDVRVYKTEVYKGKKATTYYVRWKAGRAWRKPFRNAAQADTYRGEIQAAARKGEAFCLSTGEPVSWRRTKEIEVSWYDFVCRYVDMKWKTASAKYRQDIARAMVAAMPPMVTNGSRPYTGLELRSAMNNWGLNTKLRPQAPPSVAEVLRWLSQNTRPVSAIAEPVIAREVLYAATSKLDGSTAGAETVRKHRMLLSNALDYAVELRYLGENPLRGLKWTRPVTSFELDRRVVVNHRQMRALLAAVEGQEPSGKRLVVPGHHVGYRRLIGGLPPRALWRRTVL